MRIILAIGLVVTLAACGHRAATIPENICVHQLFDISEYHFVGLPDIHDACRAQTGNPYMQARLQGNGTVFDWLCMPSETVQRLDMDRACQVQYNNDRLVACFTDFNNPITWECRHPNDERY